MNNQKMKVLAQLMQAISQDPTAVNLLANYLSLESDEGMNERAAKEKEYDRYVFCVLASNSEGSIVKHPFVKANVSGLPSDLDGYGMVSAETYEDCEMMAGCYIPMLESQQYRTEIVGISNEMYEDLCKRLRMLLESIMEAVNDCEGPLLRVMSIAHVNIVPQEIMKLIVSKMRYSGSCINGDTIEERQDEDYQEEINRSEPPYSSDDYDDLFCGHADEDWDDEDEDEDEDDWDEEEEEEDDED